jgi:hypothetical protein
MYLLHLGESSCYKHNECVIEGPAVFPMLQSSISNNVRFYTTNISEGPQMAFQFASRGVRSCEHRLPPQPLRHHSGPQGNCRLAVITARSPRILEMARGTLCGLAVAHHRPCDDYRCRGWARAPARGGRAGCCLCGPRSTNTCQCGVPADCLSSAQPCSRRCIYRPSLNYRGGQGRLLSLRLARHHGTARSTGPGRAACELADLAEMAARAEMTARADVHAARAVEMIAIIS